MKKILSILALSLLSIAAFAVPAKPGSFPYTQPDGSVVMLELHGDEFFHWTTLAGTDQVVALDKNGYWRRSAINKSLRKAAAKRRSEMNELRKPSERRTHTDNPMTHGARHIPVFLVAFSDLDFVIEDPAKQFDDLLNLSGYSRHGGTGSVQDYYLDNSKGQFQPIFDVYGPVTLPNTMKYYGEAVKDSNGNIIRNDRAAAEALRDACKILDDQIDFTVYDYDHDGEVDMTLFYFAGYNTAEWGPDDAIWPHQGYMGGDNTFDGKVVSRYFCTSELKGNNGTKMCGIGTTCHEFGHSLGLPDFYDTDYADNGQCAALTSFSTMSGGSYNNDGRTPPYFNAEERIFLGWMTEEDLVELPQGNVSFGSVKDDIAYISPTETDGEYFLYECRDASGWDSYIPAGLVVYHADKSPERIVNGMSAYRHWAYWEYYNDINAYGSHPCFYVVPAAGQNNLNYDTSKLENWVFPGARNITAYTPLDWEGASCVTISDISYESGEVSMNVAYLLEKSLSGTVTDRSGNGIKGVYVSLTPSEGPSPSPRMRKLRKAPSKTFEAMTDENGSFIINIEDFGYSTGHVTCSKEGYHTTGADVTLSKHINKVKLLLDPSNLGPVHTYSYYDPTGEEYVFGDKSLDSQMCAIRIPAADIPEKGGKLTSINSKAIWNSQASYLIVDSGTQRLYTVPLKLKTDDYSTYDLNALDLTVPGGEDLFVGIAFEKADVPYSDYAGMLFPITLSGSNCYWAEFNLEQSDWQSAGQYALKLEAIITEFAEDGGETGPASFAEIGIVSIADPGKGSYSAGDVFNLEVLLPDGVSVASTTWQFDGQPADGSVTLEAGKHIVKATVTYPDGSVEVLELILNVS